MAIHSKLRLLQIDSVFPIEGWLGFRAFFNKKKRHSSQNVFFFSALVFFFLGWLARFSHAQLTGNSESICNSLRGRQLMIWAAEKISDAIFFFFFLRSV